MTLLIWSVTTLTLALNWRKSPLNLLVLAAVMIAMVATFFPLLNNFVEPLTWRNLSGFNEEIAVHLQLNYLAVAIGFLLVAVGTNVISATFAVVPGFAEHEPVARDKFMSFCLVLIGLSLYAVFVLRVGLNPLLNRENYAEKYAVGAGLGGLSIGLNIAILGCIWAEASHLSRASTNLFRVIGIVILIWTIFAISVRSYAAILVFGYIYIYCNRRNITLGHIRLSLVFAVFALWLMSEAFALLRSNAQLLLEVANSIGRDGAFQTELGAIVGGSEFSHPFITFFETVRDRSAGELGGASYVRETLGILPQFLWPDRPETLAQEFVRTGYPELALRGGGTGFSMSAESWLNFGAFGGPFVVALLYGSVLSLIEKVGYLRPQSFIARIAPTIALPVIMAERSSLIIATKQTLFVTLVAVFLYATYKLLVQPGLSLPSGYKRELQARRF